MDHGQINKAFSYIQTLFIIFAQASKTVEPAKGAFNNPALWQNLKACLRTTMGDLRAHAKDLLTPMEQGIHVVATIENEQRQAAEARQALQEPMGSNLIRFIRWMHQHPQQPSLRIYRDLSFTSLTAFVRIKPNRPLFSAVCTDWLSTITTLGSPSRSSCKRISVRRTSLIWASPSRSTKRRQKAYTASQAGKSCGNMRHWQPARFKYRTALRSSRRVWWGLRPRPSRLASNGSMNLHCLSVKSVG